MFQRQSDSVILENPSIISAYVDGDGIPETPDGYSVRGELKIDDVVNGHTSGEMENSLETFGTDEPVEVNLSFQHFPLRK